jgi:hypothetical protein
MRVPYEAPYEGASLQPMSVPHSSVPQLSVPQLSVPQCLLMRPRGASS